jgi:hypothetical protein
MLDACRRVIVAPGYVSRFVTILVTVLLVGGATVALAARIMGTDREDVLRGTEKADWIAGGAGDDSLFGLAGNDVLRGGRGDDVLVPGPGKDRVACGTGRDTVRAMFLRDTIARDCESIEWLTGGDQFALGKKLFRLAGCGSCHALAAADANGSVGPNLDKTTSPKELVIEIVTNGGGAMPGYRDALTPSQIDAIAGFVSTAARK